MVTFVSFYTDDDIYPKYADRLVKSLDSFKLAHDVQRLPVFSSWLRTVNYKPRFCLDMLNKYRSPIVWVDCDAEIVAWPELFDYLTCDVAVCYRERPQSPHELLTGTVYLSYNSVTLSIVKQWMKECEKYQNMDQIVLMKVLARNREAVIHPLPFGYTKIFDAADMNDGKPVIVHHQASREKKRK